MCTEYITTLSVSVYSDQKDITTMQAMTLVRTTVYLITVYAYAMERSLCKVCNSHLVPALRSSKWTTFS